MTILLLCAFVLVVILIEYIANRGRDPAGSPAQASPHPFRVPTLDPSILEGFAFAENVRYHPGHTWAIGESPQFVRTGIDDFAGHLIGRIDEISLPEPGKWVRQGQPVVSLTRDGKSVRLVSPIEGIVSAINPQLAADPDLARRDPYGSGWLMTVQAPDADTSFRNLIGGNVARAWMRETVQRLRAMLVNPAPALAQDGGQAVEDLTPHLAVSWDEAAAEFFLTR